MAARTLARATNWAGAWAPEAVAEDRPIPSAVRGQQRGDIMVGIAGDPEVDQQV
jgi:hypothetical protein